MPRKKKNVTPLAEGDAFAFPLEDGRYSVCRVLLEQKPDGSPPLIACSEWIGDHVPDADDPALRPILHLTHHANNGRPLVMLISDELPDDFVPIGEIKPTTDETEIPCSSHGYWDSITCQPLAQWRWDNDRDAVLAGDVVKEREQTQLLHAAEQQRRSYLENVTLGHLANEPFFTNWKGVLPADAIRESRKVMRDTVKQLLGQGASEQDRLGVLRRCIEAFNAVDGELQFIDTEARNDIYSEFAAVAHACDIPDCTEEIFELRRW